MLCCCCFFLQFTYIDLNVTGPIPAFMLIGLKFIERFNGFYSFHSKFISSTVFRVNNSLLHIKFITVRNRKQSNKMVTPTIFWLFTSFLLRFNCRNGVSKSNIKIQFSHEIHKKRWGWNVFWPVRAKRNFIHFIFSKMSH